MAFIVIRLQDGLGNQLFQYALGRKLSLTRGVPLYLDTGWYANGQRPDQPRSLGLAEFNIRGEIHSDRRWSHVWLPATWFGKLRWHVEQRFYPQHRRGLVQESPHDFLIRRRTFDPRILRVRTGCYLIG